MTRRRRGHHEWLSSGQISSELGECRRRAEPGGAPDDHRLGVDAPRRAHRGQAPSSGGARSRAHWSAVPADCLTVRRHCFLSVSGREFVWARASWLAADAAIVYCPLCLCRAGFHTSLPVPRVSRRWILSIRALTTSYKRQSVWCAVRDVPCMTLAVILQ